ncbi:MAG: fasciclin domain-containing protein [Bacteroidota bacterium]
MKKSFILPALLLTLLSSFVFVSCDNDDDDPQPMPTIVEFAQNDANFSLLVDAVVKAELVDLLNSDGPFTLFAPTNDVFQDFLDAAGTNTVANTPKETLITILTNHVIAGENMASDLQTAYYTTASATTFGDDINANMYINTDQGVVINGSVEVVTPDVEVANGVIHVIDAVIGAPTVVTFATADPNFSTLVAALTRTGLTTDFVNVLSGNGPFTVFAPTNQAFQNLLDSNPEWNTLDDIPAATLEAVLLYHVASGNTRAGNLTDEIQVTTLSNSATFTIDLDTANPTINAGSNTAEIIFTDVQAQNGVIHVINEVILP